MCVGAYTVVDDDHDVILANCEAEGTHLRVFSFGPWMVRLWMCDAHDGLWGEALGDGNCFILDLDAA